MPLDGERLVVERTYPHAEELSKLIPIAGETEEAHDDGTKIRNVFYSDKWRSDIVIGERDGKIVWGINPAIHHLQQDLRTMGCSVAWGIEQEHNALQLLGTMIRHHQMKQYLLTGMFMESSNRSGLTYLFRKLRPTVVLDNRGKSVKILCSLCMHPIAYYAGSWAGAMCPTDDVIAHLALMRGDEHMLWKRSNQHAPHRPEAGL